MRDSFMAVDASHPARRERGVRLGGHRRLLRKGHGARRVTAATLGRIVALELGPDLLRKLEAVSFEAGGRRELAREMTPHLGARFNVAHEARKEGRGNVTVAAAGLDPQGIGVMNASEALETVAASRGRRCRTYPSPPSSRVPTNPPVKTTPAMNAISPPAGSA